MYVFERRFSDLRFAERLVEVNGLCEFDGVGHGGLHQVLHAGETNGL
jgi:hypothetical protein